jgi:ATP-dependent Clp protease ATP-binding subunit ClpC
MFERYTQTARRVIFVARSVACRTGSPEIAPHHLLLGLLREDQGLALRFLGSPWAAEEIWKEVEAVEPVRESIPRSVEIPLTSGSKRALNFAAEEADRSSNRQIGGGQCLLGLLREEDALAARILHARGVSLDSVRVSLARNPHDESTLQQFTRERPPLPNDMAEVNARIESIKKRLYESIANRDFEAAREHSEAERAECDKLFLLCRRHGFTDWIFY